VSFITDEKAMVEGQNGYAVLPLLTIGETIESTGAFNGLTGDYTPVGILDGIGGYRLDDGTVRIFVNHELRPEAGKIYTVNNGLDGVDPLELTGARISYFDIDVDTREITDGGLAYNKIYDIQGVLVTDADQLDTNPVDGIEAPGLNRFCSAALFEPEQYGSGIGFEDRMWFSPSEADNGTYWALDTETGELWATPQLGRGAWENLTTLDTGDAETVAMLLGDDDFPANQMYLYVGTKGAVGDGSFLDRNGLADGKLYTWVPDVNRDDDPTNDLTPADIGRPHQEIAGSFVEIEQYNPAKAGEEGYDSLGYALQDTLRAQGDALGAMWFSRTEDLATNPADGTQAVFANTGTPFPGVTNGGIPVVAGEFPNAAVDSAGSVYITDVDFDAVGEDGSIDASMKVLYSADAAADNPANAILRSPDNLEWADGGHIFIQEDEANVEFGDAADPREAAIVKIDPELKQGEEGFAEVVGVIDRSAVAPSGVTDNDADDVGEWETSGIVDLSDAFGAEEGELFLFDVQAHSLEDGIIEELGLVEGGQLAMLLG
jgi:hypothetical protein